MIAQKNLKVRIAGELIPQSSIVIWSTADGL